MSVFIDREFDGGYCRTDAVAAVIEGRRVGEIGKAELRLFFAMLDPSVDDDVESAWQAEIQKRLHEIETGTVSLVPWSEVRKMLDLDE